jgi:CRISPR system Cascade subunit CasE
MGLYLSRAVLKRAPDVATLQRLLFPEEGGRRLDAAHRLVWSLFASDPDAPRDFLFRETTRPGGRPMFLILSARAPCHDARLFDVESKPFAPDLAPGDRLAFDLRANPTIDTHHPKTGVKSRFDVMTMAVMRLPENTPTSDKAVAVEQAARGWLGRQALRAGFRILERTETGAAEAGNGSPGFLLAACDGDEPPIGLAATGFQSAAVPGRHDGRLGLIDFAGVLQVVDPAAFLSAVGRGFGRAKAYGCGLMLIRRA